MSDRIPPQAIDAEQAVLGTLMSHPESHDFVRGILKPEAFYVRAHGVIYQAICALVDKGEPCDRISVATALGPKLGAVGGIVYLGTLLDAATTSTFAEAYAKIVAEKAAYRRLIRLGERISEKAWSEDAQSAEDLASRSIKALDYAALGSTALPGASMESADGHYETAMAAGGAIYSSPWAALDNVTGKFEGGELVVWGASPGMGKSFAVNQLAAHAAEHHGQVLLFAAEMGEVTTFARLINLYSGVSVRRQRFGVMDVDELARVRRARARLRQLRIRIFDSHPSPSSDEIQRACRRLHRENPVVAVIVDHMLWLRDVREGSKKGDVGKHERLSEAYLRMLEIGKELKCVMHCVQHLNRDIANGKPTMFGLRDGGNAEGHAHVVILPYRPKPEEDPETGTFIVAKSRAGETRQIPMFFDGAKAIWREPGASTEQWNPKSIADELRLPDENAHDEFGLRVGERVF